MNDVGPRHPEAQTMAAFIEGALAPDEIASVAAHLRDCSDCRTVVAETARFEREEEPLAAPHRRMWWLAAAAILAAAAVLIPLWRWNANRHASPITRLIEVAPRHRFIESRLSGFPWAQLRAPSRGTSLPDPADLKVSGAAGDVLEKTANDRQPEARHAAGVAYLLIDRRADGIAALEQAANGSNDARVWSDLAAAHYAEATQDEHAAQLPLALADADHALRLDPKSPEALFNRALILEHLGIRDQARKAWHAYLNVDSGSAWSVEARAHLRTLESTTRRFDPKMLYAEPPAQLVRAFPQEARTWGEGPMLAEWADAEAANDHARAATILSRVHTIAGALAAFNGEHLLGDAVAAIEHSTPAARPVLIEAHRLYRDARIAYSKRNASAAEGMLIRAAALFREGGSPMTNMAAYYGIIAGHDEHPDRDLSGALTQLASRSDSRRFRALSAAMYGSRAIAANIAGDWADGARNAEAGATAFRAMGETKNAAALDGTAAIAFEMIGAADLGWLHVIRSCAALAEPADRERVCATLRISARALETFGSTSTAAAIIDVAIDELHGDPAQLAAALTERARLSERAGDAAAAARALGSSRQASALVSDPALQTTLSASVDVAEAVVQQRTSPLQAIATLNGAISHLAQQQLRFLLPDAYLQRARAFHATGNDAAAIADYTSALQEIEAQRNTIRRDEIRIRLSDIASEIVEGGIEIHLAHHSAADALALADSMRGLQGTQSPLQLAKIPERSAVLEYAALPHVLVIFCVVRHEVTAHMVAIDRDALAERTSAFGVMIRRRVPVEELRTHAASLFNVLIAPVRNELSNIDDLVLVSDRYLYGFPFAALFDDSSAAYLAEKFTIRLVPSAAAVREDGPMVTLQPALIIADPSTQRWPRLPESLKEGTLIAADYHEVTALSGEAATRTRFLEVAPESALIHFAGHADSDTEHSYGALLLADSAGSGVLASSDIARLKLSKQPLVVLAACGTLRDESIQASGMPGLARSFLVAGARAVAGTLWEIDDDVATPFFLIFHQHLRTGESPARAVRAAQGAMIHASDPRLRHPASWAPVELLSRF
jgi:CHAT domain-containing protein